MDSFLGQLIYDPTARGLIVISNDRNSINQMRFLIKWFEFSRFDKTRITFTITGDITDSTRLYIIPAGASEPKFDDHLIIKAEYFDKLESLFRPKPKTRNRKE